MARPRRTGGHRTASAVLALALGLGVGLGTGAMAQPAFAAPEFAASSASSAESPAAASVLGGFRLADITAADGVVLKADVFTPPAGTPGADARGRYPVVVQPASWGQNDLEYVAQGHKFAAAGYVVVTYTVRGFWGSGGEVDVAGPKDVADISTVIDWALAHTAADPDRVGMIGLSLGGGLTLLGAAFDPRIKAVASLSGWADLTDALYSGQTRHTSAATRLATIEGLTGRKSPEFATALDDLFGDHDLPEVVKWADVRSPATYLDRINANGAAVYLANGWSDSFFNPGQMTDFYQRLTVPKRLELRPGDHASQEFTGLLGFSNATWDNARGWLDRYLKGAPGANDLPQGVDLEVRPGSGHEAYPDWRSVGSRTERVTFGDTATVRGDEPSGASGGTVLLSGLVDQWLHQPPTVLVPLLDRSAAAVRQSEPYRQGLAVRGAARVHTTVTASASQGTAIAYLYDVDALGVGRLIAHAPQSWSGRSAGQPFPLDVTLFPTAYDLPAGHRLALVLGTHDGLYGGETPKGATVTFGPAELSLPVR
ncbi:CocE/NonD family hydrolase [Kitasatospora sp. NPDC096077]|uniref:CocE/NonD family hydrolase n=1 Tax=Kitasatospora sp. NPDC096077 TaxID=3155544 RepID=UPI003321832B